MEMFPIMLTALNLCIMILSYHIGRKNEARNHAINILKFHKKIKTLAIKELSIKDLLNELEIIKPYGISEED